MQDPIQQLFIRHGVVNRIILSSRYRAHMKKRGTSAKHRVKDTEVFAAHQRDKPAYYLNEPGHRALVYMLGETQKKRLILVALVPSKRSGIWEAVTAYEANAHHRDRYTRS